jgi:hypothetical protein
MLRRTPHAAHAFGLTRLGSFVSSADCRVSDNFTDRICRIRCATSCSSGLVQKLKSGKPKPATQPDQHEARRPPPPKKPPPPVAVRRPHSDLARAYACGPPGEGEHSVRSTNRARCAWRERKRNSRLLEGKAQNSTDADVPRHFLATRFAASTARRAVDGSTAANSPSQRRGRYLLVKGSPAGRRSGRAWFCCATRTLRPGTMCQPTWSGSRLPLPRRSHRVRAAATISRVSMETRCRVVPPRWCWLSQPR